MRHDLADHLLGVADLAECFSEPFGGAAQSRVAGLWHDLGKYAADFQEKLRAAATVATEAHVESENEIIAKKKVDHSTAGAWHAARQDAQRGIPLIFAIAGHHAGLADWSDLLGRLRERGPARLEAALTGGAPPEIVKQPVPPLPPSIAAEPDAGSRLRLELFTRMIFSALVDADFLDTEAFFDANRAKLRGQRSDLAELASRLNAYVDGLAADDTEVNRVRAEVRRACAVSARGRPGLYTLTVPTGGGKTLAAMEFALAHASLHGLRRVVVAIPFTSIIEQNAAVYLRAFGLEDGDPSVLEHHSALDPARETARSRVAAENWDAPIVVTTNVQLLESLLANRPSACRKLHRLARSVIVLDEAQALPRGVLAPVTDVLEALVRDYGATVVLCTATQPALGRDVLQVCGFSATTEIVPDPVVLAKRLRRVDVDWSAARSPVAWRDLAVGIAAEADVLAIVHRRDDARHLCEALDAVLGDRATVHLSALMCPAHRREVIGNIRARKSARKPVRVVSTQLVEAGVDLDFPVVYRALAGLDSLAQAAGRCNREGRLQGLGRLRVFLAPTPPPEGILVQGLSVAQAMLATGAVDLFAPETHAAYFARLYRAGGDGGCDERDIQEHRRKLHFKTVAAAFRIVDDDWSAPLVVPYSEPAERAIKALDRLGPSRDRLRAVQQFTVNVSKRQREAWIRSGDAREIGDGAAYSLAGTAAYDPRFGLVPDWVGALSPDEAIV